MPKIATLKRWSARHQWVLRCAEWDAHLQAERDRVALEYAATWERRRLDSHAETMDEVRALREKARRMLAMPLVEQVVSEDGRTTVIKPIRWTASTIIEFFRLAFEMERAVLDANAPEPGTMTDAELAGVLVAAHEAKSRQVEREAAGRPAAVVA